MAAPVSSVALSLPLSQADDSINLRPRLRQLRGLQRANRECANPKTHRSDARAPLDKQPMRNGSAWHLWVPSPSALTRLRASPEASWGLSTVCSPRPSPQPRVQLLRTAASAVREGTSRRELLPRFPVPPEVHRVAPVVTFPQSGIHGANPTHAATLRCPRLLGAPLAEGQSPRDLGPPNLTSCIRKMKDRVPLTWSHHSQPGTHWAPDCHLTCGSPCG